jgi:hypothetical protein
MLMTTLKTGSAKLNPRQMIMAPDLAAIKKAAKDDNLRATLKM